MTSKQRAPLEKHLERKCVLYAEGFGYETIKLDNAKRGWPDRLFLGPNAVSILVEFKRAGGKARKKQDALHRRLTEMGHPVYLVDNFDDFTFIILERLRDSHRQ